MPQAIVRCRHSVYLKCIYCILESVVSSVPDKDANTSKSEPKIYDQYRSTRNINNHLSPDPCLQKRGLARAHLPRENGVDGPDPLCGLSLDGRRDRLF